MLIEVDHLFVTCAAGAPEGDELIRLGFVEGSPNTHPGQGTANRRFFFDNFMLELLWVTDEAEAMNPRTQPTRLWERWSKRQSTVNPFGIVFRAAESVTAPVPFATWSYHPIYLPATMAIEIAVGTGLQEPELFYLPFLRNAERRTTEPTNHLLPLRKVRGIRAGIPQLAELSSAARSAEQHSNLTYFQSPEPMVEILFSGTKEMRLDLRPTLPLVFGNYR